MRTACLHRDVESIPQQHHKVERAIRPASGVAQGRRGKELVNKSCQVDGTMTLQDTHSDVREQCLIKWSQNMAKLAVLPEDSSKCLQEFAGDHDCLSTAM